MNDLFKLAIDKILASDEIFIASHVNPDGDNIGSIIALGLALKKLKKNVRVIKTDEIPTDYLFLPFIDIIQPYEASDIDLLIVLDCGDIDRLGKYKSLLNKAKTIINIDHHISNTKFGTLNIVDDKAAATGELIYDLLKNMSIEIDKDIATCLYAAISTDTGSFMYDSVTSRTHKIIASLIETGIDKSNINIKLYQSRSIERTNLFIKSFSTLKTYHNNRIAVVKVTQSMLNKSNAKMEDTEGIISFIRDIDTVEVACLLKEYKENEIKVSLRSKRTVDVSKICSKFNGGGHIRAAGCTIYDNIFNAENKIVEKIIDMW
jgi:phosphoesterase RecJ-like protein